MDASEERPDRGGAERSRQPAQKEEEEPPRDDEASRERQTDPAGGRSERRAHTHTHTHTPGAEAARDEDQEVGKHNPRLETGPESSQDAAGHTAEQRLSQVPRLTPDFPDFPDFPDALLELLCTLQEGRRLNDQRCSFPPQSAAPRRRCHSEPNAGKPASRVVFSSMTSLQKEEFFELVATAQGRRLDDQRAKLGLADPPKAKSRSLRGSWRQLSLGKKTAPLPAPKEDLYTMILTTQAQGRLEDQRSRAPGPMDDEDFFLLLLRVQGGRMDEQRTAFPSGLQT
ncbi:G-protein-signaling modulator 2 [Salarias fasciatus]|uniref:G-protein-signaling modulator 2 n=1 Tax=Salarias fasciatus TaxID=181472 RepID=UPI0011769F1C|nr:G-protein-signaling modulator 2-like [Salarias fasciatus]